MSVSLVLEVLIGVVLAALAYRAGQLREQTRKPAPIRPICECDHQFGTHKKKPNGEGGGACNALMKTGNRITNKNHEWVDEFAPCACLCYTGPIPLSIDWIPPMATSE